MRRALAVLVMAAALVPGPVVAQSPAPSGSPSVRTVLCVEVVGAGPWTGPDLIAAIISGEASIAAVELPAACPAMAAVAPEDGPVLGDSVNVADELLVTVREARFYPSRGGRDGVAAFLMEYQGLAGGNVSSLDWSAYADGVSMTNASYFEGIGEALEGQTLPPDRRTSGWVVFSGPLAKGQEVILTYGVTYTDPAGVFDLFTTCCRAVK